MPYVGSNITPQRRALDLPGEFVVKDNQLFCKWCEKVFTSLRMDNLRLHLTSSLHKENKLKLGGPITINNISRKQSSSRERKHHHHREKDEYDYTSDDDDKESSSDEHLSQLFEDSDSGDTESFQGFDDDSNPNSYDDSVILPASYTSTPAPPVKKKRGRPPKQPFRLPNVVELSKPKRGRKRKRDIDIPTPIRAMPLKKQMSYLARTSRFPPAKKAKLKIKIRRRSQAHSKSFEVESSDDSVLTHNRKVTSYKRSGDGLKMKFVLNKPKRPRGRPKKIVSPQSHPRERPTYSNSPSNLISPVRNEPSVVYSPDPVPYEGVEELIEEEVVNDGMEVVEEEIVGVDDGEVVSWDAVVGEEEVVEEEVVESAEAPLNQEPVLTSEESLAIKANYAREMAKAVNSAQFKKKRLVAKKLKIEEKQKRRVSAYNLWSGKMRKQVATQYPGLQFGEVSQKLGSLWKKMPDKEKQMWKHRSDKMTNRLVEIQSNTAKRSKGSKMIETGPKKKQILPKQTSRHRLNVPFVPHRSPELAMQRELQKLPKPNIEPIDAAAHFRLLGQALARMGKDLQTSRRHGYSNKLIPIMLDSLLCSFAPLLSLTNQIPQLEGSITYSTMVSTYSNIAHVMPGF